jgi:diguanylate cyclase (GGDEF)-like protein
MHTANTELMEAFAASQANRAGTTAERQTATETRAHTRFERTANATRRDEQATLRDVQASARDRTADLRDQASEEHERALGDSHGYPSRARATAAADRVHSTEDRAGAAEDRKHATLDREQGAIEFENAQLDDLTGFYRLGLGTAILQREIDRSRRSGGRMTLAYCDVDGLKQVNDEEGHAAGDALLMGLAEAIRSRLRSYDPVVRVGGDEFVCALSEIDAGQVGTIFHDIQDVFAKVRNGPSVSFGLATLRPDDDLAALMERGDHALRGAKSERGGGGDATATSAS